MVKKQAIQKQIFVIHVFDKLFITDYRKKFNE